MGIPNCIVFIRKSFFYDTSTVNSILFSQMNRYTNENIIRLRYFTVFLVNYKALMSRNKPTIKLSFILLFKNNVDKKSIS